MSSSGPKGHEGGNKSRQFLGSLPEIGAGWEHGDLVLH